MILRESNERGLVQESGTEVKDQPCSIKCSYVQHCPCKKWGEWWGEGGGIGVWHCPHES